jgi:hypothetical protein
MGLFGKIEDFFKDIFGVMDDVRDFLEWSERKTRKIERYARMVKRYEGDFEKLVKGIEDERDARELASYIDKVTNIEFDILDELQELLEESREVEGKLRGTGFADVKYVKDAVMAIRRKTEKLLVNHATSLDQLERLGEWAKSSKLEKHLKQGLLLAGTAIGTAGITLLSTFLRNSTDFDAFKTLKNLVGDKAQTIMNLGKDYTRAKYEAKSNMREAESLIRKLEQKGVEGVRAILPVLDDKDKVAQATKVYVDWLEDVQRWAKSSDRRDPPDKNTLEQFDIRVPGTIRIDK